MSYQYGQLVYGSPVTASLKNFFSHLREQWFLSEEGISIDRAEELLTEWEESEEPFGFQFLYSSGGESKDFGFLGVALTGKQDLDSWTPFRPKDLVSSTPEPTLSQRETALALFQALPPEIKACLSNEPDVWLIWGSS